MRSRSKTRAFSLVELVIVVVIIGVIAAIAVPRISRGAKGAGQSAVRGSLASLRNAIDMYAAEHGGAFPASGTVNTEALLIDQLTKTTKFDGTEGTGPGFIYGPYLRKGFPTVPVGPQAGKAFGVEMTGTSPPASNELLTTKGWVYCWTTGEIIANTNDPDENGVLFDTY